MTTETANTILIILALSVASANCLWKAVQSFADFAFSWIKFYRVNKPDPIQYTVNLILITAPLWGLIFYQWGLIAHVGFTLLCMMLYIVTASISTLARFGGIPSTISLAQAYLLNQLPVILLIIGSLLFRVLCLVITTHLK